MLLARLLTPRETGIYAVGLATAGAIQVFGAFGVGSFVVRATDATETILATAFTVNAAINLLLTIAIFSLSHTAGLFMAEPGVTQVLRLLALAPLISIFDLRPSSMLQRMMQFERISLITVSQAAANMVVSVGTAFAGASYMSAAYGAIAAALTGAVGYSLAGRQHVGLRLGITDWRNITLFGLRMMSVAGISALATRLSDIILGRMLGLAALGLFSRASSINMLLFQSVYGTATRVIFVRLSQIYRDQGALKVPYLRALRSISGIMSPVLLGLAVLSKPVILLLFGERWLGAALPLSLLLVAQFLTLRFAMHWELFVIKDELRVQTNIEAVRSTFTIISRTVGCFFSIVGAAAASMVDAALAVMLYGPQINRMTGSKGGELTRAFLESGGLAALAVGPSLLLMIVHDWDPATPLPLLAAGVAAGAALWVFALRASAHPLFAELQVGISVLQRRLRRA